MRALIVSLTLAVVVVTCMAFIVLFAGLDVSSAMLFSIGLGIFMFAALFAAIAALGPKSRPTPLLTPTIAGTMAAVVATVVLIGGSAQVGNTHRSAMRASEPAKVALPPQEATTPAPETANSPPRAAQQPSGPEPIRFPEPAERLPRSAPTSPDAAVLPAIMAEQPTVEPAEEPAPTEPQPNIAETVAVEPAADSNLEVSTAAATAQEPEGAVAPSASSTTSSIPIPPVPPPPPARQDLSRQPFDTSNPPPLPNAQAAARPPSTNGQVPASPPLPRTRPCGAGGPLCP